MCETGQMMKMVLGLAGKGAQVSLPASSPSTSSVRRYRPPRCSVSVRIWSPDGEDLSRLNDVALPGYTIKCCAVDDSPNPTYELTVRERRR